MIKSIIDEGLNLYWTTGDTKGIPSDIPDSFKALLNIIDYLEEVPKDFETFNGLRLTQLKEDDGLQGFWALQVIGHWFILFRFDNGNAFDLDFVDVI